MNTFRTRRTLEDVALLYYFMKHAIKTELSSSMTMLLIHVNDLLNFVVATHEDTRSIMDIFGNNSKHTFHAAVDRLASSCPDHVSK